MLATWDKYSPWEKGDTVRVAGETLTIAGLLSYDPFNADGLTGGKMTLITSGETFARLTGETGYSLLMIQTEPDVTDADVAAIRTVAEQYGLEVNDRRGQRTSGTYTAFVACVYAFLGVLTLVTVLNIVNGISMSVTARTRQYGAMRAVGMDGWQLTRMILAESATFLGMCGRLRSRPAAAPRALRLFDPCALPVCHLALACRRAGRYPACRCRLGGACRLGPGQTDAHGFGDRDD